MGKELTIDLDEDKPVLLGTDAAGAVIDEDAPIGAGLALDADIVDEDLDPVDRLPKQARRNADGSVTLSLLYPRTIRSKKDGKIRETVYSQIVMHRLTGADQRAIAATSEEMMAVVAISRSSRITQAIMNALYDVMDAADINACGQVLNHFLSSGRKTGK
jgi:hypothetical protein